LLSLLAFKSPPRSCLELCAGMGGLIEPIVQSWPTLKLVTCDIDQGNHSYLKKAYPTGKHFLVDVTSKKFETVIKQCSSEYDLAICNPPFCWSKNKPYYRSLFNGTQLANYAGHERIRLEIIFALQNIRLIGRTKTLIIILPELIVKGTVFRQFREYLVKNHSVDKIMKIEPNSFKGTEAQTYAISILKEKKQNKKIEKINIDGTHENIPPLEFVSGYKTLNITSDQQVDIFRGNWTGKKCNQSEFPTFHTTSFRKHKTDIIDLNKSSLPSIHPKLDSLDSSKVAKEGDILIARVGSRTIGRMAFVERGRCIISDCIISVRFPSKGYARQFYERYKDSMQSRLKEIGKGTCAKYLTHSDINALITEFTALDVSRTNDA
jgi:tRNA1(Val) A37 N6-methylase TrmN6